MSAAPVTWDEDELYGRYEVRLRADVGSADQALGLARDVRQMAVELSALGFELEVVHVIGAEAKRRAKDE